MLTPLRKKLGSAVPSTMTFDWPGTTWMAQGSLLLLIICSAVPAMPSTVPVSSHSFFSCGGWRCCCRGLWASTTDGAKHATLLSMTTIATGLIKKEHMVGFLTFLGCLDPVLGQHFAGYLIT